MSGPERRAASARLGVAREEETTAAEDLRTAQGTVGEFHAAVQLRAAEDEVEARTAWLAWTDRGDDRR